MSISKAQSEALAEGFLDSLGSADGFQPRETLSELFLLAGELVEDAQKNLNAGNHNASGKLTASLVVDSPAQNGNVVRADILMNYYGRFINKGVRGTVSGSGLYAFKHDHPSRKLVEALRKSAGRADRSTSNTHAKKSTSMNEKKNVRISEASKAYAAGMSIVRYGIKATGFLDKAVITAQGKIRERLGAALKIDVIDSITHETQSK